MPNGMTCHSRRRREELGLSQAELARRVGITRQAISAIEAGSYVPSTLTALEMARALETTVERLFVVQAPLAARSKWTLASVRATAHSNRVTTAVVREKHLAYPTDVVGRPSPQAADGILDTGGTVHVHVPGGLPSRTAVVFGCDPALDLLAGHFDGLRDDLRVLALPASSGQALAAAAAGDAHVAGSHLGDPGDAAFGGRGGITVCFAAWEQGLAVQEGNPLGISGVQDLLRPALKFVNREPGSGARAMIDHALAAAGLPVSGAGEGRATGHFEVAMRVAAGRADVGVCPRFVARSLGLGFVPIAETRFDLSIPADLVTHPAVAAVLDLLSSARFREMLSSLPGYSTDLTGKILAEVPAA